MKAVAYGTFNMQADGVRVIDTDVYSAPPNKIQADALAERDGSLVTQQQFDSKPFNVSGLLVKSTEEELEDLMDVFKQAMARKNQPFDIQHGSGTRRYLASAQNIIISKRGLTSAAFSVQFFSPDGMGWDLEARDLISTTNVTLSNVTIPLTVEGSYKADPIIRITVNTVTGGSTNKTISISNAATLRSLSVTGTWTAGTVLEIDTLKGQLLVDGLAREFRGQLPSFDPGEGALVYLDDFTSRDVTILSSYTRRWL